MISMGGSDPRNITRKIVKLIVIVIGLVFIGSGFIALLLDNEQYLLFPFQ